MNETIIPGAGYDPTEVYVPPTPTKTPDGTYVTQCSWPYVEVRVWYTRIITTDPVPASVGQPYIPPSLPREDANENAGWGNSSARSVQPLGRSQRFVFSPGHDDRGFFVGLGVTGKDTHHPSTFFAGLMIGQSGIQVYENGGTGIMLATGIDVGDIVTIEVDVVGRVTYRHSNGDYRAGSARAEGTIYVYAQGYQAQDVLLSARIEDFPSFYFDPVPESSSIQRLGGIAEATAFESIQRFGGISDLAFINFDPVPESSSIQRLGGIAEAGFISIQRLGGIAEATAFESIQRFGGISDLAFINFDPVPESSSIQRLGGIAEATAFESIQRFGGISDLAFSSSCTISAGASVSLSLSNSEHCWLSMSAPNGFSALINNDIVPPRLNSMGGVVMPITLAIDGGGMIATCTIDAKIRVSQSIAVPDNYCDLGLNTSVSMMMKNSPAGYIWTDDSIHIVESSSFLRDVLINLYSSLDFIDGLSLFKDIAVGLIESNLIYDVNDIIADKDILLEETCNLLDSLELNINGLPDYTGGTAWVINMETGATSLFLDYDYNSFMASPSGEVYGVCKDGVYLLNGTGSTAPMSAIDYGIHRFGSETKKMIPHFYASVASTGRLILKLAVGECEYEYYAMSSSEYLDKHRIDIGKGIGVGKRFIFANPVLIAPEGTEIKELEILEYLPVAFDRRK
jgi:hypothetical protein